MEVWREGGIERTQTADAGPARRCFAGHSCSRIMCRLLSRRRGAGCWLRRRGRCRGRLAGRAWRRRRGGGGGRFPGWMDGWIG